MLSLLVTTFLIVTIILILLYDSCNRSGILVRKIPGKPRLPIVGNSFNFLLPLDKLFIYSCNLHKELRDIHQIHTISDRIISFLNPQHIETILSSSRFNGKYLPYSFLKSWLGEGLLTSQGKKWQQRRKLLTQAFHFNILKKFSLTFIEQAEEFVDRIQDKVGEKETDIVPLITLTTVRVMCVFALDIETAMGSSMQGGIETVTKKYSEAIADIGSTVVERLCKIWLHNDWIFQWSSIAKIQKTALKNLHYFTNKIIKERRIFLESNKTEKFGIEDGDSTSTKGRLAMLDLLLEKESLEEIDVNGIREEVDTFMFEGHDTTAQALIFLIMRIANEIEVQEKIYHEMETIFGDSKRTSSIEDLNKMKYLECCIKETLRIYPSVPHILRYITEETCIGGYRIPQNSMIHISIYDLHHREDIYPEPERFIPERFLPEACAKRHPYAYIPFSAGPRNCIGQKFAMLEIKTMVSSLLRRFRLEAVTKPSDLTFRTDIILRTTQKSIYVKFLNR